MKNSKKFDVIIIGGSYAGLSAAMSLGRSLRNVLVVDSGKPCNSQTPHSHNLIAHDGATPREIAALAKSQVQAYDTVQFYDGFAIKGDKIENGFEITTNSGAVFVGRKIIFATGLKDIMPDLKGFQECWGISILHCPYCHGYEVKNQPTGILMNGEMAFDMTKMIYNWTKDIIVFTNGKSTLTKEQHAKLDTLAIRIVETEIDKMVHTDGILDHVLLKDTSKITVRAVYARPNFIQHSGIPEDLGCDFTEQGLIKVDMFQKTTIEGVYACGDNSNFARSLSMSITAGSMAGVACNRAMIEEDFDKI